MLVQYAAYLFSGLCVVGALSGFAAVGWQIALRAYTLQLAANKRARARRIALSCMVAEYMQTHNQEG